MGDKAPWIRNAPKLSRAQIDEIDRLYRMRLRSLRAVDDLVAAVVKTLHNARVLDNTYVVFSSDNGFHLGEHRQATGKGTPYEESIRVPLIVRGPGVPAGRIERRLAVNTDLAPTFAALAGGDVPSFVDGRSLAPLLHGDERASWRKAVLVELISKDSDGSREGPAVAGVDWEPPRTPSFRVVREGDYTFFEFANGERELYDLRRDPYQMRNLARDRPEEVELLAARLDRLSDCGERAAWTCRSAEEAPLVMNDSGP